VVWIHLAQDRDRWQAVVNAMMNLWVLVPRSQLLVLSSFRHVDYFCYNENMIIYTHDPASLRQYLIRYAHSHLYVELF
jgi:hypothetical protein